MWSKSGKIAPQPIEGSIPVLHISGMLPACFISLSSMSGTRELHLVLVVSKTRNQLDSVFMFRARSIFDRLFLLDFSFVLWYHNSWESICDWNLLVGYCRQGGDPKTKFFQDFCTLDTFFHSFFYPISSFVIESYLYETDFRLGLRRLLHASRNKK